MGLFDSNSGGDASAMAKRTAARIIGLMLTGIAAYTIINMYGVQNVMALRPDNNCFQPDQQPGICSNVEGGWVAIYLTSVMILSLLTMASSALLVAGERFTNLAAIGVSFICAILLFVSGCYTYFQYGAQANTPGQANNFADDPLKCCVPDFYNNPAANGCPAHVKSRSVNYPLSGPTSTSNVVGCLTPLTIDKLKPNAKYESFFWGEIIMFGVAVATSGVSALTIVSDAKKFNALLEALIRSEATDGKKKRVRSAGESLLADVDDDDDDDEEEEEHVVEEEESEEEEQEAGKEGVRINSSVSIRSSARPIFGAQ
jgi:hypothetical protein